MGSVDVAVPQGSRERDMHDHLEDGELDVEDGEVPAEGTLQSAKLSVPEPPASPVYEGSVAQRKPKKPKLAKAAASGYHDIYGHQARAEVQMHVPGVIRTLDVQGLLLWVLADGMSPRWCFVKNKALVSKVVMIGIPGLEAGLFKAKEEFMPIMHSQLATPATVLAKNATVATGSTLATLFTVPLNKKRKRDSESQHQQKHAQNGSQKPFPPAYYAVTLKQMEANYYPLPIVDDAGHMTYPSGFVATQPAGKRTPLDMVSVDCEMCVTAAGYELTRASLVDSSGQVLLDELVLPDNPITDYNTQYSGITAQALANTTTRLADIQKQVCEFVSAETLLVGHALENDLKTLKIIHANCLDTVMMFPHPKGPPAKPALRFLTERHLKRVIQQGEHDSVVDARAALDLAKLKIAKGPAYGTPTQYEEQGDRLMDVLHAHKRRCTLIDKTDMLNRHVTAGASAILVTNDDEAMQKACKEATNQNTDFVWTQFRALGTFLGMRAQHLKEQQASQQQQQQPPQQQQQPQQRQQPPQQQQQPQQRQQSPATHDAPQDTLSQEAGKADGQGGNQAQANGNAASPHRRHSDAMAQDVARAVDGAMEVARANGDGGGSAGGAGPTPNAEPGCGATPAAQNDKSTQEHAASTREEHTEEHKVVKIDQDEAGNQQAKAEVVQKNVTKVKKRKRVEQSSAGSENSGQPGAGSSSADQVMPDASPHSSPDKANEGQKTDKKQAAHGSEDLQQDQTPAKAEVQDDSGPAQPSAPASEVAPEQAPTPPAAKSRAARSQSQDVSEEQLNRVLKNLDEYVGRVVQALPVNSMLVVYTCQGDTAEYRRIQEQKMRRQARLDNLPPWTLANEAEFSSTASRVCRALCFASVKQ